MGLTCYFTYPAPMNKRLLFRFLPFLLLMLLALGVVARAQTGETGQEQVQEQAPPDVSARLISGLGAVGQAGDTLPLGLDITLPPGWKTYWRFPGAAGYPATLTWETSQNLKELVWHWPAPRRFSFSTLQSFGYDNRVVIPLTAHLAHPGQPLTLKGTVELMMCRDVCIPETVAVSLSVPKGPATPSPEAAVLQKWQKKVPVVEDGTSSPSTLLGAQIEGTHLVVTARASPPFRHPDVFVETPGGYVLPPPQSPLHREGQPQGEVEGDGEGAGKGEAEGESAASPARLVIPLTPKQAETLAGQPVTLTLVEGARAVEKKVGVEGGGASAPLSAPPGGGADPATAHTLAVPPSFGLWAALLTAFIGGLILNLMPCVLPVLSLKLLSVVQHGNSPPAHVRVSFLASAAGILASFLVLAGVAVAFREAGAAVGWGVQFQHPVFLGALVLILTLFAASLWDLIHIPLPRFLTDALVDRLPEPGHRDGTVLGHFLTGAFTTLLATPCSAPFVGTAIGFALAGSSLTLLLVALSMGLGLATPFLLVAAFPQVARRLPRPGRWMSWLRGFFGIALMITALWLASVWSTGRDTLAASTMIGSVFLILFILWIRASFQRPFVLVKGIAAIAIGIYALQGMSHLQQTYRVGAPHPQINWVAFDESVIPALVASGKVVFVDVTAGWCLTCKANKTLVLGQEPTLSRLRAADVITMQADWTRPEPAIGLYLKKFGRYGIPFNAVYGPGAPAGLPLPELLSADGVHQALERARAARSSARQE